MRHFDLVANWWLIVVHSMHVGNVSDGSEGNRLGKQGDGNGFPNGYCKKYSSSRDIHYNFYNCVTLICNIISCITLTKATTTFHFTDSRKQSLLIPRNLRKSQSQCNNFLISRDNYFARTFSAVNGNQQS